jgi:hypothetical protein
MIQVFKPYSPILLSGHYFAFLDHTCAFLVFKGEVQLILRSLSRRIVPDMSLFNYEVIYQTIGDPLFQGKCIARLFQDGVFVIHHIEDKIWNSENRIIWKSHVPSSASQYASFILSLSDTTGELEIQMIPWSGGDSECVWSSLTCNKYFKPFEFARSKVFATGSRLFKSMTQSLQESLKKLIGIESGFQTNALFRGVGKELVKWYQSIISTLLASLQYVFNSILSITSLN